MLFFFSFVRLSVYYGVYTVCFPTCFLCVLFTCVVSLRPAGVWPCSSCVTTQGVTNPTVCHYVISYYNISLFPQYKFSSLYLDVTTPLNQNAFPLCKCPFLSKCSPHSKQMVPWLSKYPHPIFRCFPPPFDMIPWFLKRT